MNDFFRLTAKNWCWGSSLFCDYVADINNTFSEYFLKESVWPTDFRDTVKQSSNYKRAKALMENIIIVRLQYKSSEVEMNKLELRTTMTDKIANFGGTFGIWAELTGCSLLGMINLVIISFKLIFRLRN